LACQICRHQASATAGTIFDPKNGSYPLARCGKQPGN
jgi:hypothetical protein